MDDDAFWAFAASLKNFAAPAHVAPQLGHSVFTPRPGGVLFLDRLDWGADSGPALDPTAAVAIPPTEKSELSALLSLSAGLGRLRLLASSPSLMGPNDPDDTPAQALLLRRRPVASGGARYPADIYLYLRDWRILPRGLYFYDVPRHALVSVARGDFDAPLLAATTYDETDLARRALIFVTCSFGRTRAKYHDFAYRLAHQDAGVLLGQTMTVAQRLGGHGKVCFLFDDEMLTRLLGIDEVHEGLVGLVGLLPYGRATKRPAALSTGATPDARQVAKPSSHQATLYRLREAQQAAKISRPIATTLPEALPRMDHLADHVALPHTPPDPCTRDFLSTVRQRGSSGRRFCKDQIDARTVASLLRFATGAYDCDVQNAHRGCIARPHLGVVLGDVEGIPAGVYAYDPLERRLWMIRSGDHRAIVAAQLKIPVMNLRLPQLHIHLVGKDPTARDALGPRGYRVQQAEAGIVGQRIQFAATALGLCGHHALGYNTAAIDRLYGLPERNLTTLQQVSVGRASPEIALEGGLLY